MKPSRRTELVNLFFIRLLRQTSRTEKRSPTMRVMLAVIWHFWLGVALAGGAIATVVMMVGAYFKTVESTRYPKER